MKDFNPNQQHTLQQTASISGTGLHTGALVNMSLKPAEPGFGYQFKRIDLEGQPTIKADCDLVVETTRGTTLESNGARISTVEHILAALVGMGVDNCLIEVDGPEIPIIDGSSKFFVEEIEKVGVLEQDAPKDWYIIDTNIIHYDEERGVELKATPAVDYHITTLIDFNSDVLGTQHASLKKISDFKEQIAASRTFCFLHELEALLANNLIKGGDINNAIVVVEKPLTDEVKKKLGTAFKNSDFDVNSQGFLNNLELRYTNEPARHKLLDIVGDLALVGFPFKAHIISNRPGHFSNVELAKKIKQHIKKNKALKNIPNYDPTIPPLYNSQDIEKKLPHRYPFLLVDKIIELSDNHIVGVKNVTANEQFFQGHFPGNPIMPGVLQIEALAQAGGILAIHCLPPGDYDTYFLKIDNCKFKMKVVPGDTLLLKLELLGPIRRGICEMIGTVFVGNKIAAEATLMAQLVKRENN
ncbi:MAG: bifunctional UDP-3-O-[3-hydroxymyristoyl] N-acetylglucosamine deacetylase/3-hydroxyacyl-ACP dehydratase [Chitinophagaceae bacterium]